MGGIESLISFGGALLLEGVRRVRPRLLGFRFCGVGGFTKVGDEIAAIPFTPGSGKLVVDDVRPVFRDVSTARFLRLRPFFGALGFCSSKKGLLSSAVRGRNIPAAKLDGGGDSGEEPGDGSVALESSTVDIVVVGDESVDPLVVSLSL